MAKHFNAPVRRRRPCGQYKHLRPRLCSVPPATGSPEWRRLLTSVTETVNTRFNTHMYALSSMRQLETPEPEQSASGERAQIWTPCVDPCQLGSVVTENQQHEASATFPSLCPVCPPLIAGFPFDLRISRGFALPSSTLIATFNLGCASNVSKVAFKNTHFCVNK